MEVKSSLRHLRVSPKKVRLVVDLIRGKKVDEAVSQLTLLNKKSSDPILKLLNSAIANAKNNFDLEQENLYIKEVFVNESQTLKRWMPRAFGRATPIRKRASHVVLNLDEIKKIGKGEVVLGDKKDTKEDIQKVDSLEDIKKIGKEAGNSKDAIKDRQDNVKSGGAKKGFAKKVFNRKSV